jgi:hypothetical protein
MPELEQPLSNGVDRQPDPPKPSIRDIAEKAYDELLDPVEFGPDDPGSDEHVDAGSQPRDAQGRFVAKSPEAKPGEAEGDQSSQPRTDETAPQQATPAHPAPSGRSSEPPQHWSPEHRATFSRLPPEAQAFLLDRHADMERDYQGKVQANAVAVQFAGALVPVFQDPVISGSLQQAGLAPVEAIQQWGAFHRRMVDPNPAVRFACWQELGQRIGLDPAAIGQLSRPGQPGVQLSEQDLKDPAIKFFADHLGRTSNDVAALRNELQSMRQSAASQQRNEAVRVARWQIDSFAEEKDAQGNLLRPHFDAVLPALMEMYRANPDLDLNTAYQEALWRTPETRAHMIAAEERKREQAANTQRAKQAVRSNVRGNTSPVSKPQAGDGKAQGLRAVIEAAADEIGL